MFGYVKPYTPELRMKEYELYRAIYCGLCREMGRVTGQLSRLSLSYDFAFLAALRLLATENIPEVKSGRCAAHPVKKRHFLTSCDELTYCAAASAYLMGGKLDDDLADEGGVKRLRALLAKPFVGGMIKSASEAVRDGESLRFAIEKSLSDLANLEAGGSSSVDSVAECFGQLCGNVFSAGLPERSRRILYEIGFSVGKFIYVADAADDLTVDVKHGKYNPIAKLYGEAATEERNGKVYMTDAVAESLYTATLLELKRCEGALELLCDGGDRDIASLCRNIVYLGLPEILKNILVKRTGNESLFSNNEL